MFENTSRMNVIKIDNKPNKIFTSNLWFLKIEKNIFLIGILIIISPISKYIEKIFIRFRLNIPKLFDNAFKIKRVKIMFVDVIGESLKI